MSNARIMLQATGEQDSFLTTGAKHTLFKEYHRRHALFGLDWNIINLNYNNTTDGFITAGSKHYFRIDNNGDLINEIYLRLKIKKDDAKWGAGDWNYETIFKILDSVEFMCNDKQISTFTSDYMFSYFELNYTESDKRNLVDMTSYAKVSDNGDGTSEEHVYLTIPIPLWFHKNPGSAFPMWALHNPNIGINVGIKSSLPTGGHINDIEILMSNSDLCIGAGGTTNLERCCVGVPSIVTIVADNQKEGINFLSESDHVINLGLAKDVTTKTYLNTLKNLDSKLLSQMSQNNQKLVDGLGCNRIKNEISKLIHSA